MRCTQPVRRSAQVAPNRISTIYGERTTTFAETESRVSRLATALKSIGVREGDRVAILSLNSDRYYESFFAIAWAGAVVVPLNIRWSTSELVYSLNDSGAMVLLVGESYVDEATKISREASSVASCVYLGDGEAPEGMLDYERLIEESSPTADAGRGDDDLFGIFYTGGTTGFPKGVMLSHKNFYSSSLALLAELSLRNEESRYLHAAPMFHIADAAVSMAHTIAGSSHVFIPGFDASAVVRAIGSHRVTDVLLVPTMITLLLENDSFSASQVPDLRKVVYGASPMPEGTLIRALDRLPGVSFFQAYGQTELAPVVTVLRPEHHLVGAVFADKRRSAGRACAIVEIKIEGSNGKLLAAGEVGEVLVSGPNAMLGYWRNPEQTEATLVDGWVRTGDAGFLDDDGFLFLVDRVKDMIVSGGENVFSAEVEHVISKHPSVQEVAVVGIPDSRWGEAVHAVVRLRAGTEASEQELIEFSRQHIAKYKCPRSVEFRSEPLPTTSAGKISKKDIRKPYWEGHNRSVN